MFKQCRNTKFSIYFNKAKIVRRRKKKDHNVDPGPQNPVLSVNFPKLRFIHDLKLKNKLSIDVWFVMIWQYLAEVHLFEYLESEVQK